MISIVFDETQKSFSAVQYEDQRDFATKKSTGNVLTHASGLGTRLGKGVNYVVNNKRGFITGGSAVLAGAGGAILARRKAQKDAEDAGLQPGTAEYKAYVRKRMAAGAAIGAAGGALVAEGAQFGANVHSGMKGYNKAKQAALKGLRGNKRKEAEKAFRKDHGIGATMKSVASRMYKDPASNAWNNTKSGFRNVKSTILHPMATARGAKIGYEIERNKNK